MRLTRVLCGWMTVGALAACSAINPFGDSEDPAENPIRGDGGGPPLKSDVPIEDPKNRAIEELPDPFHGMSRGSEQLAKVCARGQTDAVTRTLCGNPSITGLAQLQSTLGLVFTRRDSSGSNGQQGNPAFALLAHSSSLVTRGISAINPRAFLFSSPAARGKVPGFVVTSFARGENFVEIAAHDATRDKVTFYVVQFDLPCAANGGQCLPGDMLTPAIEQGWQGWHLYQDEDLKNNILDCRHCHQPDGPTSDTGLRMQELRDPWTHWLRNDRPGGIALMTDFLRAHGDQEDYGGIPAGLIQKSDGLAMEDLVSGNGFSNQPNVFDTKKIEAEVKASASAQPEINDPPGRSATWQAAYERSVRGEAIPPPYHDVKVTDAAKLEFATGAYRAFLRGGAAADLPDIRRVFLDSALPDMTIKPKLGSSGRSIIVQTCGQCHNPKLDQTLSRARFDVTKLDTMPVAMKTLAIARMKMPAKDILHMPPAMMRYLPDDQLDLAVAELSK